MEPVEAIEAPAGFSSKSVKVTLVAKLTDGEGTIVWYERSSNGQFREKGKGESYNANVRVKGGDGDKVYYVAVRPAHRKKVIGAALMAEVERGLARAGCPKLNLQVRSSNMDAVSFYRHLGYEVEGRVSLGKSLGKAGEPENGR